METLSDVELAKRLDHLDEGIHAIRQQLAEISDFIDEHKPALARGMALMDPGSKIRAMLAGRPKGDRQ
jgi:hypothetical protein